MRTRHVFAFSLAAALTSLPSPGQQPWFDAPVQHLTMQGNFRLLGDLDLDGDLDAVALAPLASSALGQATFTAWRNVAGNFEPMAATGMPLDAGYFSELADLDGDGRLDLIAATLGTSATGSGILVFPGQAGFAFGAPTHLPFPGNVVALQRGNGNGDGVHDVVLRYFDGAAVRTAWLFGSLGGAPVLGPGSVLPTTFTLEVFDADGDGLDDIAIAADNYPGAGTLQVHVTTPTGFAPYASVPLPPCLGTEIVVVDVDGDADLDLVGIGLATTNTLDLTVATNHGGGMWTAAMQTLTGLTSGGLFAGDWDGDGLQDLLLRGYTPSGGGGNANHYLQRLRNLGGSFAIVDWVAVADNSTYYGAGIADFDLDGDLDFLDAKAVWRGNGTLAPLFEPVNLGSQSDWDGDGDLDSTGTELLLNDGNGVFTAQSLTTPSFGSGVTPAGASVTADFDGDGLRETIFPAQQYQFPIGVVFLGTFLLQETGDFTFVDGGLAADPGARIDGGVVSDADGDGDLDILNAAGIWHNDGTGYFTLLASPFPGMQPVACADLDGDGDDDLLAIQNGNGYSAVVMLRTAADTYVPTVLMTPATSSVGSLRPRLFDVDDDGDLDVVAQRAVGAQNLETRIFTNVGGVFSLAATLSLPGVADVGDVDGDGLADLVYHDGRVYVHRRIGPGLVYADPVVFAMPYATGLVDVDQDGDLDMSGSRIGKNRRLEGAAAGHRRQYGHGSAGVGGRAPLLSVVGPVRGGETPSIRLRNAPGGTVALLIVGTGAIDLPSVILQGVQSYVFPIDLLLGYTTSGAGFQPGVGGVDIPVAIPNGLGGASLFFEYVVLDPSLPGAFSHSNGCEMAIGG